MPETIRVAVVDDHPLVLRGIEFVLESEEDIKVVAHGSTMEEAIAIVKTDRPDIMLLDVSIPGGGLNALKAICEIQSATKIVMLTVSDNGSDVMEALGLGAAGYVLKGIGGKELVEALHTVRAAGTYMSPQLGMKVLTELSNEKKSLSHVDAIKLSDREKDVLSMIKQGSSNKEIGLSFNLREKTVKHYMTSLLKKFGVRSRTELALAARNPDWDKRKSD